MVANPRFPKQHGQLRACHDGSPSVDFYCECGALSHVHESQLADVPREVDEIGLRCHTCRQPMIVSRSYLEAGLADARRLAEPT
jgi:hypothetical protein